MENVTSPSDLQNVTCDKVVNTFANVTLQRVLQNITFDVFLWRTWRFRVPCRTSCGTSHPCLHHHGSHLDRGAQRPRVDFRASPSARRSTESRSTTTRRGVRASPLARRARRLLIEGRVAVLHLWPPCSSFSWTVKRFWSHLLRSHELPEGLPNLSADKAHKVRMGNELLDVAITLFQVQHHAGGDGQLEQPTTLLTLLVKAMLRMITELGLTVATRSACADGALWRKDTTLVCSFGHIKFVEHACISGHQHILLEGRAPCGRCWTAAAAPYWHGWARTVAGSWRPWLQLPMGSTTSHRAGFVTSEPYESLVNVIDQSSLQLPGRTAATSVAQRVPASLQPSRRVLPQLVPDGLSPKAHLQLRG